MPVAGYVTEVYRRRVMLNYAGDAGDRITQDAAAWRWPL